MDKSSVRHPSHYASEGIECIDAMYAISPAMAIYFSVGSALKSFDRAVWGMREGGMSVPAIADALNVSQARVEGAIGRVEAGRYGGEGVI